MRKDLGMRLTKSTYIHTVHALRLRKYDFCLYRIVHLYIERLDAVYYGKC